MRVADCRACDNCPIRGDGSQRLVPDVMKPGASVYLLAEQAGERDPVERLARTYLPLSGLSCSKVSVGHAIRCTAALPKPVTAQQFEKGVRGVLESAVDYCRRAHSRVPALQAGGVGDIPTSSAYPVRNFLTVTQGGLGDVVKDCDSVHSGVRWRDHRGAPRLWSGEVPRLVVTQGDLALYAATGQRSSHEWRGWMLPYQPPSDAWLSDVWMPARGELSVLSTVSPADIAAMPTLTYAARADWKKAGRILRGEWPMPWPGFDDKPPAQWPRVSAFDTEFDPETGVLERYSLYDGQGQPWVIEAKDVGVIEIPETVTVVMHNVEADLAHLQGFLRGGAIKTEDTMYMHAVLWSDLPHSLEYLGSIHSRINRWKHLFRRNPKVYSGGDAIGTWDVYLALVREFREDPASARVYRDELFPLTPIIMEAETVGQRLHQERVRLAVEHYTRRREELIAEAQAWAGYPLLLSSPDQVSRHLFEVEKVGVKGGKRRRARTTEAEA